jgi:hypothetical protein
VRKNILALRGGNMRKILGLFLLVLFVRPMLAKENWPLTVKVLSTKNIEDQHGTFHLSFSSTSAGFGGSSGHAGWVHRVHEHAFVDASDGNSYELQPTNPKDMLLPGTYQAKIEKRDMKVCEPKDNGNCREVKFWVVQAVPTVKETELAPKGAESASAPMAAVPSPAPTAPATPPAATQATLAVDSTPAGADVEIDGAFVGNTPSTVTVAPGSHQIVVKKKGFTDWTKTLNVTGGTIHLNAELEAGVVK